MNLDQDRHISTLVERSLGIFIRIQNRVCKHFGRYHVEAELTSWWYCMPSHLIAFSPTPPHITSYIREPHSIQPHTTTRHTTHHIIHHTSTQCSALLHASYLRIARQSFTFHCNTPCIASQQLQRTPHRKSELLAYTQELDHVNTLRKSELLAHTHELEHVNSCHTRTDRLRTDALGGAHQKSHPRVFVVSHMLVARIYDAFMIALSLAFVSHILVARIHTCTSPCLFVQFAFASSFMSR